MFLNTVTNLICIRQCICPDVWISKSSNKRLKDENHPLEITRDGS